MTKLHYNSNLKSRARNLRNQSTLSEVLLWNKLKRRQMMGYQFLRQRPVDQFIVDFFCHRLKLIIEIDGDSHIGKEKYDQYRHEKLEKLGFHILRFSDSEVKQNMQNVLMTIAGWIKENE